MSAGDYPYNDDLLSTPSDQAFARKAYGPISFALIFPELLEKFAAADAIANTAKRQMRRRGLCSIALVTIALLTASASASPLYRNLHSHTVQIIIFTAAAMGALGGLGGMGLFSAKTKESWLQNRLVTESLRQWHFRTLMELSPEILAAAASGDPLDFAANPTPAFRAFDEKRRILLSSIEQDLIRRSHSELEAIIDPGVRRIAQDMILSPYPSVFEHPHGQLILHACGKLWIHRQMQFADHKLSRVGGIFSSFPRVQTATLNTASAICVVLLLTLHISSAIVSIYTNALQSRDLFAVWTALLALALRAIDEGLKPHAEVERYLHYRAVVERIQERFETGNTAAKHEAIAAMARAAYDEMVIFLQSQHEARFTI